MFRDDTQMARCCRALLAQARLASLWTVRGPTRDALVLMEADGGPLSSGERIVLLAAFAFWNGRGGLRLSEILETLGVGPTRAIASLALAVKGGADAVDEWLGQYEAEPELRALRQT